MKTSRLEIAIDLCLDLKLYRITPEFLNQLEEDYPGIKIHFVNCSESKNTSLENVVVYFGNRITPAIYALMPNLKWIHFGSSGVDRLRFINLRNDVIVTNSRGIMSRSVSLHALGMILYFARGFNQINYYRNNRILSREDYDLDFNYITDLNNKIIGLFGRGESGQYLKSSLEVLGCKVDLYGRNDLQNFNFEALNRYSFIINILPLDPRSKCFFDYQFFSNMSKSAVFINVGRGETVVELDLIRALKEDSIRGAGLDVFESEPLAKDHVFSEMSNVLVTPHVAGLFSDYWQSQQYLFLHNLNCFLNNKKNELINIVDYE